MRIRSTLLIGLTALMLAGCAHQPYPWQYVFREEEVGAWRKSIEEAINSPDEWARVGGKRLTSGWIKYYMPETEYNLKCPNGQVEAVVPTSGKVDVPNAFKYEERHYLIRLRLDRGTALVVWMNEELEP